MKKKYLIIIHIIFWILLIFNGLIINKGSYSAIDFSGLFVNICTFYLNYFVIIPFVFKKNRTHYFVFGLISAFLFFAFLRYSIEEILFPIFLGFSNYSEGTNIFYYIFDNFYWGSNAIFISSLIWFLDYAFKIKTENQLLIEEKKSAEISLLKSQINPHFIFNTLNNIYSLVSIKSEKALSAIDQLSSLLRFSSLEMTRDYTLLTTEISYIENLIALESLRYEKLESVCFEKNTQNSTSQIAPMLLIPFVENAFKHGDVKNFPMNISVTSTATQIIFEINNKIRTANKDKYSGIGLENVKKRLALIYPEKHELFIDEKDADFSVFLKIEI